MKRSARMVFRSILMYYIFRMMLFSLFTSLLCISLTYSQSLANDVLFLRNNIYHASLLKDEANDSANNSSIDNATVIPINENYAATVSATDSVDWYFFDLNYLTDICIQQVGGSGYIDALCIATDKLTLLKNMSSIPSSSNCYILGTYEKGRYFLKVSNFRGKNYSIKLSGKEVKQLLSEKEPNDTKAQADTLKCEDTTIIWLSHWSPDKSKPDSIDWHFITLPENGIFSIDLNGIIYTGGLSLKYSFFSSYDSLAISTGTITTNKNNIIGRFKKGDYFLSLAYGDATAYKMVLHCLRDSVTPFVPEVFDSVLCYFPCDNYMTGLRHDTLALGGLSKPSYVNDRFQFSQSALRFNGSGYANSLQPIVVPNNTLNCYSIAFWANISPTEYGVIISMGKASSTSNFSFAIMSNFNLNFEIWSESNSTQSIRDVPKTLSDNWMRKWTHFCLIRHLNGQAELYVNGQIAFSTTLEPIINISNVYIGSTSNPNTTWRYVGDIDEIFIYHKELSSNDIAQMIDFTSIKYIPQIKQGYIANNNPIASSYFIDLLGRKCQSFISTNHSPGIYLTKTILKSEPFKPDRNIPESNKYILILK